MAYTQTDIDNLKAAVNSGALRVRHSDGREVTYRSIDEIRQLLAVMQSDVGSATQIRQVFAVTESGWGS